MLYELPTVFFEERNKPLAGKIENQDSKKNKKHFSLFIILKLI